MQRATIAEFVKQNQVITYTVIQYTLYLDVFGYIFIYRVHWDTLGLAWTRMKHFEQLALCSFLQAHQH